MRRRLFETFGPRLGITEDENDFACERGVEGPRRLRARPAGQGPRHPRDGRARGPRRHPAARSALPLGPGPEPRHPGGVPGPRVTPSSACAPSRAIAKYLDPLLQGRHRARAAARRGLELNHVWPENYSVNSAQKVWAAGFAARHPNVVVLDLSSFKCGHDAPTYGLIDSIIETSKTPYAALHDIDANKPGGSIKIRVKTYAHALKLHEERLQDARKRKGELEHAHRPEAPRAPDAASSEQLARAAARPTPRSRRRSPRSRERIRAYEAPPPPPARARDCRRGSSSYARRPPRGTPRSRPRHHKPAHPTSRPTSPAEAETLQRSDPTSVRTITDKKSLPVIDIDAELKAFEDEERKRLGLDDQDRAVGRGHGQPHLHEEGEGGHHDPGQRPDDGARLLRRGRAQGRRLQRPDAGLPRRRRPCSSARSSATAASATRRTSPSATW